MLGGGGEGEGILHSGLKSVNLQKNCWKFGKHGQTLEANNKIEKRKPWSDYLWFCFFRYNILSSLLLEYIDT
jgi:hypothetical protein